MLHVGESCETKSHNLATTNAFDVGNEGHTTCVVFKPWVVETVGSGEIWVHERLVLYGTMASHGGESSCVLPGRR